MEVRVKLENCNNKKWGEYVSVPALAICMEELSDVQADGCDMLSEDSEYDNVKTRQCQEGRNVLDTEQNSEESSKIIFLEEVLRLGK